MRVLVTAVALGVLGVATLAQSVQDVLTLVQENPAVPQELRERLSLFLQTALNEGLLTASQALTLLAAVGWQELSPASEVGFVAHALELALVALGSGVSYEEVLTALTQALEEGAMGPLVATKVSPTLPELVQALVRARTHNIERILARVAERVHEGVPLRALGNVLYQLWNDQAADEAVLNAVEQLPAAARKGPPSEIPGLTRTPSQPTPEEEEHKKGRGRGR